MSLKNSGSKRVRVALPYSWLNVANAFEAGERFLFKYKKTNNLNGGMEYAIALHNTALTKNRDVLNSFTRVDFIVSSAKWKDSIRERGIGLQASDTNATYNTQSDFMPYIAGSISFDNFEKKMRDPSVQKEPLLSFIIKNGNCASENVALYKKWRLIEDDKKCW